jgi:hypothetical protein
MPHDDESRRRRLVEWNVAFKQMITETCFDSVSIWSRSEYILTDDDKRDWLRNSAESEGKTVWRFLSVAFYSFPVNSLRLSARTLTKSEITFEAKRRLAPSNLRSYLTLILRNKFVV